MTRAWDESRDCDVILLKKLPQNEPFDTTFEISGSRVVECISIVLNNNEPDGEEEEENEDTMESQHPSHRPSNHIHRR